MPLELPKTREEWLSGLKAVLKDLQSHSDEIPDRLIVGSGNFKVRGNWLGGVYNALEAISAPHLLDNPEFRRKVEECFDPIKKRRQETVVRTTREEIKAVDKLIEEGLQLLTYANIE